MQKRGEKQKFSGGISSCLKVILLYVVPNNTSTRYTQLKAFGVTMALLTSKLFSKNRQVEIKDLQSVHSETYKLELRFLCCIRLIKMKLLSSFQFCVLWKIFSDYSSNIGLRVNSVLPWNRKWFFILRTEFMKRTWCPMCSGRDTEKRRCVRSVADG